MRDPGTFSRRSLLRGVGLFGLASGAAALRQRFFSADIPTAQAQTGTDGHTGHGTYGNITEGDVDAAANGFDPTAMLTDFDYGTVSTLANGQTLREYRLVAAEQLIEIAPGVTFPAWSYNGRVPGPTLRCTQGDRLRITFINASAHPHSIHFHGIHSAAMDGLEPIVPGGQFVYEFDAEPFGLHLYHCHTVPLKRHLHKGLYGAFIIDPPTPRPTAKEFVMVMNGFDTNFDGENEFYAVNTVAFHYARHPIPVALNELVRVYLVNVTEFDPINSFHLHANFFNVYRTGTRLEPHEFTDMIMLAQAERHVLEFSFKFPGQYMFHAHQSELAELGWMGMFAVQEQTAGVLNTSQAALFGVCPLPPQSEVTHG
ncbi:MAG TPA: multicopper oxidase domain-containing protein [Herpetosiphonaceae bacterium]